jgi:hypothetical protein
MTVTVDVGPHLDALAHDPFDGEATAVNQRVNIFDMESAGCGAFYGLRSFVHGDAIDMETTSRFI